MGDFVWKRTSFDVHIRYAALRLKLEHPHRGATYIVKKMSERTALSNLLLPEITTVWCYWRSFGERLFHERHASITPLPPAGVVNSVWQMDFKESVMVAGVGTTTFTQARDEFARATIMHRVHSVTNAEQRIVKLTTADVRQDCRSAFTK